MSDESDEEIVTAIDILEQEKIIEEEASALFGDFDNNICTYEREYLKRQPLYSCLTCKSLSGQSAGICLACSLNCHEGHNLVELYTKRLFRCDCGNKKFKDNNCVLNNDKEDYNCNNNYNQNFDGLYCTCKRPYPDEDLEDAEEEMIQCVICEDWYHMNHLGVSPINIPDSKSFSELICTKCANNYPHLFTYNHYVQDIKGSAPNSLGLDTLESLSCFYQRLIQLSECPKTESTPINPTDDKLESPTAIATLTRGPLFWPSEKWRELLCLCEECMRMYKDHKIEFLLDPQDSLVYFTKKRLSTTDGGAVNANEDSNSCESQYEKGLAAFSTLNKVAQNEMLHQFNSMKENFKDYLKDFVTTGKVVKKDDILEFFEREAKKPKIDSTVPSTCR